jgi:predicted ATPase/DNA-binding CsgD family transcriptional regulator
MAESVTAEAGGRHLLLILDNCEHVIDAAAAFAEQLLKAGDDLRVLTTSRQPLGVEGEALFALGPMTVPPGGDAVDSVAEFDAAALFEARASLVDPDFALGGTADAAVTRIVRRLDGMPLAIELAAGQLDVMGLDQLASRLDDSGVLVSAQRGIPARQASLTASIDWSYRLLDAEERSAFGRLAVFPAPFSLEAARAAVGSGALELLSRLVRRSMVMAPRPGADGVYRYSLLETLRGYARDRLAESGQAESVRAEVAAWMTGEAERVARGFELAGTEAAAARWMDAEQDNLRDVLAWALSHAPDLALRLAVAVSLWWRLRGHYQEGSASLARAVAADPAAPAALLTTAEVRMGRLALLPGDYPSASAHFGRAVELAGLHGLDGQLAEALNGLSGVLVNIGQPAEAVSRARHALAVARHADHPSAEARACLCLAMTALYQGDWPALLDWAQQAVRVDGSRISGDVLRRRVNILGYGLLYTGDLEGAEALHTRAVEDSRRDGDRGLEGAHLLALAHIQIRKRQWADAAANLDAAMLVWFELGGKLELADCLENATVWAAASRPEASAILYGATRALYQTIGFAIESNASSVAFLAEPLQAMGRDLGQDTARRAQQRGAAMPLQEAVEFARQLLSGTGQPAGAPAGADLSPRERELLALLAGGRTDQQIAEAMFISIRTVRSHLDRIRDKTGCRRRAELTSFALEHGMVTGESPSKLLGPRSSSDQPLPEPRVNAA